MKGIKGQTGKMSFETIIIEPLLILSSQPLSHIPNFSPSQSAPSIMSETFKNGAICWVLIPATDVIRGVYPLVPLQRLWINVIDTQ